MSDHRYCPRCAAPLVALEFEGRLRQACLTADCGYVNWDNPVPIVAALVEHEGMIVLARNRAWAEGTFALIAGFVERGESAEEAVAREVSEELNLSATRVSLLGVYPWHRKNELIIAYHVVAEGEIVLNEELAEIRRIPPDKLRDWDAGTGLAVRDWLLRRAADKGTA